MPLSAGAVEGGSHMGSAAQAFTIVMIKPSHYDDDGYPITWYRSIIPSNTLAALYGMGRDCARRKCLARASHSISKPMTRPISAYGRTRSLPT